MSFLVLARILLPILGLCALVVIYKLAKSPKEVFLTALKLCWVAGLLNLLVDIFEQNLGFWHYTAGYLVLGYPIDLYVAVSFFGAAFLLVYWRLRASRWLLPILALLPVYLVFQDYAVSYLTGKQILSLDSPYWWLADWIAICVVVYGTMFVFKHRVSVVGSKR